MVEFYSLANGGIVFILPRGGELFPQVLTRVDADALTRLEQCSRRWPLEDAEVLAELKASISQHPGKPHWLACETAFFCTLPSAAAAYALPKDLRAQGFRKYGSNGIFHQWAAEQFPAEERIVSVCLNDTPSAAAIINRSPIDTSGGYSLLDGIPGRLTCGSIDPSIVLFLTENDYSADEIEVALYRSSGWEAIIREYSSLEHLLYKPYGESAETRELLMQELLKAIGGMLASLGGANRIIIGGGEISGSSEFIAQLRSRLAFIGVQVTLMDTKRKTYAENIIRRIIDV
jgi:acetate kinase